MKLQKRDRARILRSRGYSINQIIDETGYSKASISVWVRDIKLTAEQKQVISGRGRSFDSIEKRRASRLNNEISKRRRAIEIAKNDYSELSKDQLKLVGIILYLGEGAKTKRNTVCIANSDPAVIKIALRFFREVCEVPEEKFRIQIHTHSHSDVVKVEKYWSKVTGIPRNHFYKTYIKQSAASLDKRHTLTYGTVDLSVNSTDLLLKILGWIERIKEILVP
jgi:hypothetical protein